MGCQCPPPGDLPDPQIEPASLVSPAVAGVFFFFFLPLAPPGKPIKTPAAAAAKSLQSCPTLCDPIDGSPLHSGKIHRQSFLVFIFVFLAMPSGLQGRGVVPGESEPGFIFLTREKPFWAGTRSLPQDCSIVS